MSKIDAVQRGRPPLEVTRRRVCMMLRPELFAEAQALAATENRSLSNMLEIMIERGLRSYGLEVSAA